MTELATNLLGGLYLLFNHNAIVLSYFAGLVITGLISFIRPSRLAFVFTFAFAVLTFGYEYDKHIIEALRNQTLETIAPTPGTHVRATKLVDLVLSELLPVFFYVLGWGLLLVGIAISLWRKNLPNKN